MGPRSFNRGNYESTRAAAPQQYASMGPRSFNRGNVGATVNAKFSAYWLQWGRGLSTAEMATDGCQLHPRGKRFNGAAVFQPRKSEAGRRTSGSTAASMGPRSFNRGNSPFFQKVNHA